MVAATGAALASPSVPAYSSLPGAPHTLYLNFGGISLGDWSGHSPGNVPAYDTNSNPSTFSASELSNIRQIWGRVAEAYSPFNVNVTTVAPGSTPVAQQWSQVVIARENENADGTSRDDWYGLAGGVSQIWGFNSGGPLFGTGWAFTNYLSNGTAKYTAVAAVHEAGHQFGLDHQRAFPYLNPGNDEYRPSTDGGYTSPIMGIGYYTPRTLWSNGTCGTSLSVSSYQDDVSILVATLGYRPDDDNHDFAHAKPLTLTKGTKVSDSGVIKQSTEADFFSFTTVGGQVTLNVLHNSYGGMLDTKLLLYGQDDTLLQTIDSTLSKTSPDYGLDATFNGYLSAGTYYLEVTSHGCYGDMGQYTVTGTVPVPEPASLVLLIAGMVCLLARAWRRRVAAGRIS
jgi:hypothetical protein